MMHTDRLEKIKLFAIDRDNQAAEVLRLQKERIKDLEKQILSMKADIKEIIEIGNACKENKIPLYRSLMEHGGYDKNNFRADGVSHTLGFKITRDDEKMTLIGFSGGGACSYEYFYVNAEGNYIFKENSRNVLNAKEYVLTSFVENFEKFKDAFYKYVDNLIK